MIFNPGLGMHTYWQELGFRKRLHLQSFSPLNARFFIMNSMLRSGGDNITQFITQIKIER